MFDSLSGGFLPVAVLSVIAGIAAARLRLAVGAVTAVLAAVIICFSWFWIDVAVSREPAGDGQDSWALVATYFLSLLAVPCAAAGFVAAWLLGQKQPKDA